MPSSYIAELPYTCSLDDRCKRLHIQIPTLANPLGCCLNRAFPGLLKDSVDGIHSSFILTIKVSLGLLCADTCHPNDSA